MRIVYEDDAVLFAADIADRLRFFGYWEQSDLVDEVLAELEQELPSFPNFARELIKGAEYERAIKFFFFDPKSKSLLSPAGQSLIDALSSPTIDRRHIEQSITEVADRIQYQDFNCRTPLNVLAGLVVLFDLTVLPRRNYQQAEQRLQTILSVQLQIVNESGATVYGPKDHSDEIFEEDRFWKLFDTVITEFQLSGIEAPNTTSQQGSTPTSISPETMVGLQARLIAGRLIDQISQDRVIK